MKTKVSIAKKRSKSAAFSDLRFSAAVAAASADFPASAAAADLRVSACTVAAATPAVQICVFFLQQQPAAAFQQPAAARSSVPACSSAQPAQQQRFPAAAVGDSDQQ